MNVKRLTPFITQKPVGFCSLGAKPEEQIQALVSCVTTQDQYVAGTFRPLGDVVRAVLTKASEAAHER